MRSAITARLDEFLEPGNLEQSITYADLHAEITEQIQAIISDRLEEVKRADQACLESFYNQGE